MVELKCFLFSTSNEIIVVVAVFYNQQNDEALLFVFLSLVHQQLLANVIFCQLLKLEGQVKMELKKILTHGGRMSTTDP